MHAASLDDPPNLFAGCEPTNALQRHILAGDRVDVPKERIALAHDVLRLFRIAAFVRAGETPATKYPPAKIWNLDVKKIGAFLARVLDERFTKEFRVLTWSNTMNDLRAAFAQLKDDESADAMTRIRRSLVASLSCTSDLPELRAENWRNFQDITLVLAPIFAGEVTRADLSA